MKHAWKQALASCRSFVAAIRARWAHLTGDEQMAVLAVLALFLLGLTVRTVRMILR